MQQFDHEKLDVYQTAVDWVALAQEIVAAMLDGNGHGPLADQRFSMSLSDVPALPMSTSPKVAQSFSVLSACSSS
jgi:hypothetical protein